MKVMKYLYSMLFSCLFLITVSCSDSDTDTPIPNGNDETSLDGTYEGFSFAASVANGLVDGNLSGTLKLNSDGTYSSTISPFSLVEASGDWSYVQDEDRLIFNEGETTEEKAEKLTLDGDTLSFTIYRGEPTNQTVIDFVLLKE